MKLKQIEKREEEEGDGEEERPKIIRAIGGRRIRV